ncbi:hypothetical protein [Methanoregula formicica]|uniref:hypothetical protein n=1 Tax=Methanoregula formicica TaxID=882104 RepID=UPI00130E66F4|nr:hypothetical protein [Methanoregula formicica]
MKNPNQEKNCATVLRLAKNLTQRYFFEFQDITDLVVERPRQRFNILKKLLKKENYFSPFRLTASTGPGGG